MKRAIGRVPGHWDDDQCVSWAKGKHVARVYPQYGVEVARVEYVDIQELPLNEQFKMAKTLEEKVAILGRRQFGLQDGEIIIVRGATAPGHLATEDEEETEEVNAFFCEFETCDEGPNGNARFFDSEKARDMHQRSHKLKVEA